MSEYIDDRIVSIKFDNSGFAEGVSETQKSLDNLNKSLSFEGASEGGKELAKTFKDISTEAKKTDLSPVGEAVEHIGEKFNALKTIATGAFLKIGADAVEMGKKLIKAVSIDPISQGFDKYQSILTSQMTLTAALGGKTEEEIEANAKKIKEILDELAWYADETSYSLDDMVKNVSQFANYGIDLEDAKTAMMGIANASAKSGAPLSMASHAMEGFSKAMGQGYMSYQVWRTWLNSSKITTLDFKQTMIDTAKAFAKEAGSIGNAAYENGELIVDMGKTMGKVQVTAENLESTLTKGRWLTTDVMLAALSKYSASMDDLYEATEHGERAVSELFATSESGFDKFSTEAFKYAQQCKTLNDVIEALFDATSTTWYRIFQSLIGDYKQTVDMWSNFAEYLFDWFVYPLQDVASMIKEFAESNSNIMDEQTGKVMTMRDVIVNSFMNIMEAISSVINPIREAFDAVFHPFETMPEKLQNGVEKFHDFTKSLILTKDEAERLRDKFIAFFSVLKNIWGAFKTIGNIIKKYVFPIIKKVAEFAIKVLTSIFKVFIKIISVISSFVSQIFGVRDIVADIKEDILEAAESIDYMTASAEENEEALDSLYDSYTDYNDLLDDYISKAGDATDAIDDLTEAEKENAKTSKNYTISGGYDGTSYLSYYQALEKTNNKRLAEFIKEKGITEKQYNQVIKMLNVSDKGYNISLSEMAESAGITLDTMSELYRIIDQTTAAYDKTDRAISNILNKDTEVKKWGTIWDGINEAQKATLITSGDQEAALQMYFKKGIKDYKQIADAIGIEEWKIREVIEAYKEAYDVEELLSRKKLEVNADNIDSARQELGYIKRKNQEKEKELGNSERDIRTAERNARIAERNQRIYGSANRTTSKSVQVIGNAIKQIPVIGTAFKVLGKIFGSTSKATKNSSKSVNDGINSVRSYIDEISDDKFITTKDNFYEVKESVDDVTKSVKDIADETSKTESALKKSTLNMSKYFKDLSNDTETSSKLIGDSTKKITEIANSKNGTTSSGSGSGGSLVSQIETLFSDSDEKVLDLNPLKDKFNNFIEWLKDRFVFAFTFVKDKITEKFNEIKNKVIDNLKEIKNKSIKEVFEPLIIKIKEIWTTFSNVFKNIKEDMNGFFDAPVQTLSKVIEDIKNGFKYLFSKEDIVSGVGGAVDSLGEESKNAFLASIDEMLDEAWKKIKDYFKNKVNEARSDEDNPFYGLVTAFDNIVNWWDDFSYDITKFFSRIKESINVVFGPGTVFEKLSSGILWRPFLEAMIGIIDKFDNLSNIISSIKKGIENASGILDQKFKVSADNILEKFNKIKDFFENFSINLENAKEALSGGGGGSASNDEENGGLIGIIAKISLKWDNFKKKLEEGINWDDIGKVSALESILERIIDAIARAWIRIGLSQMAIDIGNFFASIADGFNSLAKAINREKDTGDILIKIASAFAILALALIALSSIDSTALDNAISAIDRLAVILVSVAASMAVVIGILRFSTAKAGGNKIEGGSIGEILAGGLSNLFGTRDTMAQASKLLVGIGLGLVLLSGALAIIIDATKDVDNKQIGKAILVLVALGVVLGILFYAISKLIDSINGKNTMAKSGPGLAINLKNKEINKTVSEVGESLKGFALALGVMIAGFVIITKVLEDVNSDWNVVAAFAILIVMIFACIEFIKIATEQTQKLSEGKVDPKLFSSLADIMKALVVGVATMIYGFKVLTDVIITAMGENPDSLMVAVPVFFGMIAVIGLFLFGVLAACRYLLGEKTEDSAYGGLFRKKGSTFKQEKIDSSTVSDTLKSVSALIVSLGFGVKLMAAAFKQVIEAVKTGMEDPLAMASAAAAFVMILLVMTLMVIEISKAATKMPPGQEKVIYAFAVMFVALALSVKMIADAIGDLAKKLSKANTGAMIAAIAVVGVLMLVIGAIIAAFVVLSEKGKGGSLMTAGKAFALIGVGLLAMAAAVYVLARGIQEMVVAMSMVGSASDQMKSGLQTILDMIARGIGFAMTALIQGFISGIEQVLGRILHLIEYTIMGIIAMADKVLPAIADSLEKNKDAIITIISSILEIIFTALNNALPAFAAWFNNLQVDVIYPALDNLLKWIVTHFLPGLIVSLDQILDWLRDSLIPSLLNVLKQIIDAIIGEPNGVIYQIENAIKDFVIWLGDLGEEVVNSIASIWAAVHVFIVDTLFPDIEDVWQELLNLLDQLIDDMLAFLDNGVQDWGHQIVDIIVDIIDVITDSVPEITNAIEKLLLTLADSIVSLFQTGGTIIGKLLAIPAAVVSSIVGGFRDLLNGGNIIEQIFGDMGEGKTIEDKAGDMWERIKSIFTDKKHADINESKKISESAKKWGTYIANGVSAGLNTVPKDLQSNVNSFLESISKAYFTAAGLDDKGDAVSSGKVYKLGMYTVKGVLKGLKEFATSKETKDAAEKLWKEIDKQFRKSAKIKSPSRESYKWGQYIGKGLTNGLDKSANEVGQAAVDMWTSFSEPMTEQMDSFAAVTSSMLSQLLDANMDFNPVITPVFDMTNLDAATSSMSAFFDSKEALEVAGSFNGMKRSRLESQNNQNESNSLANNGPTYNYVQNNYSPKALSAIEIYRRTKNQLNFRTSLGG